MSVNLAVEKYKKIAKDLVRISYPTLTIGEIDESVNHIVDKCYKDSECRVNNNYLKKENVMLLSEFTNYVLSKQPICCSSGVLFKQHGTVPNPLRKMILMFMKNRDIHKKQMFQYPKGSEDFEKYNLLQLLDKVDANAIYGTLGAPTAFFYNINVASSITYMGQTLITTAMLFFEQFLANNVKFSSLEEVLIFIYNIINERNERKYKERDFIDRNISVEECFEKVVLTIGDFRFGRDIYLPDEEDLNIIWDLLCKLPQDDINRIYYKNNLYEFMNNSSMTRSLIYILQKLENPYLDPNDPPEEIKVELETLTDILKEFVYYKHMVMDRVDRCDNMIKKTIAISDTDSAIVSLDPWYGFALSKTQGVKMKIKQRSVDISENELKYQDEYIEDYDFVNDNIIQVKKMIQPMIISPPEGLRYSIINIMAYIVTELANDYMKEFAMSNNSFSQQFRDTEGSKCMLYLKNEFLFKRVLLPAAKKNYASIMELQEGNQVPEAKSLDIKGLAMKKSTVNKNTQKDLEKILYEDILRSDEIDQIKVIKDLAILEKKIYQSLESGSKDYYKPAAIKSMASYDDPMGTQGIKASVVWNAVRDDGLEAIDLDARNTISIVKVNITEQNIDKIKDTYPETYEKFVRLMKDESIFKPIKKKGEVVGLDNNITSIAIPIDVDTPKWVMEFIDYKTIINDNLKIFPVEAVGIQTMNCSSVNYSNLMQI